jgi:hypothetical protein
MNGFSLIVLPELHQDIHDGNRPNGERTFTACHSNMACWKIHHSQIVSPANSTSIFAGDFPASHV